MPDWYGAPTRAEWETLSDTELEEIARADKGTAFYIRNWLKCWDMAQKIVYSDLRNRFEGNIWLRDFKPVSWDWERELDTFVLPISPGWGRAAVQVPIEKVFAGEPRLGWTGSVRWSSWKWVLDAIHDGFAIRPPHGHDAVDTKTRTPPLTEFYGQIGSWVISIADGHHRWEIARALGETEIIMILLLDKDEVLKYKAGLVPWKILELRT